jgi:hydrogenase nickel incorporation protein HypA/HybF
MHELSIALSLLDLVEEEAGRRGVRVAVVHVRLGPLSGVVRDALVAAFELAREGTPQEQANLVIEEVPVVVSCPRCAARKVLESAWLLCCPTCGTPTPEILSGRELDLVALEIDP